MPESSTRRPRASIDQGLRALKDSGGSQINVLTVGSLGGLPIEQASINVVDQWKLGQHKLDNGVLFLIAPNDHKLRIEVGRGLEGTLTDADSKRILDEAVLPLIRTGDFSSAILVGVYRITQKTDPKFDLAPYLQGHVQHHHASSGGGGASGLDNYRDLSHLLISRTRWSGHAVIYRRLWRRRGIRWWWRRRKLGRRWRRI